MRVFISADIEGTTLTTLWDETEVARASILPPPSR